MTPEELKALVARILHVLRELTEAGLGVEVLRLRASLIEFRSDGEKAKFDLKLLEAAEDARIAPLERRRLIERLLDVATERLPEVDFNFTMDVKSVVAKPYRVVEVFYGTDRAEEAPGVYGSGRSPQGRLNYGVCEVSVPEGHKKGEIEKPKWWKFEFRPDPAKHMTILNTVSLEEEAFVARLAGAVAKTKRREALVFVHGYKVTFADAAMRTGQVAHDLEFDGVAVMYSWPSYGGLAMYTWDEANNAWTIPHLERFLTLVGQRCGVERVHVIAHSMGNRAVCEALKDLSRQATPPVKVNHLVMAAPDIDAQTFAEMAAEMKRVAGKITLYQSAKDKALDASATLHALPRAGQPLLLLPEVDTIDASAVDTDFLAHSYFGDEYQLLADIHALIAEDKNPPRFGLREETVAEGKYYAL